MSLVLKDMLGTGEYRLMQAGVMNPKADAEELYMHLMGVDKTRIFMDRDKPVDIEIRKQYFELIDRRKKREPLQYIVGTQNFMGMDFIVNEKVLIPRPETEQVVERALKIILNKKKSIDERRDERDFIGKISPRRIWKVLDLCCGCGAIGVTVAKRCMNARVTATDISKEAIVTAEKNAAKFRAKVEFYCGDVFEPVRKKSYDIIISNPPYIKSYMIPVLQEEIKTFEPLSALDGGEDGLDFYRCIISEAPAHLKRRGVLIMETGHDQGHETKALVEKNAAYSQCMVIKDLNGYDRILIATVK